MGPLFNYGVSGLREDRILGTKTGPTLNGDGDGDGLRELTTWTKAPEGATQDLRACGCDWRRREKFPLELLMNLAYFTIKLKMV